MENKMKHIITLFLIVFLSVVIYAKETDKLVINNSLDLERTLERHSKTIKKIKEELALVERNPEYQVSHKDIRRELSKETREIENAIYDYYWKLEKEDKSMLDDYLEITKRNPETIVNAMGWFIPYKYHTYRDDKAICRIIKESSKAIEDKTREKRYIIERVFQATNYTSHTLKLLQETFGDPPDKEIYKLFPKQSEYYKDCLKQLRTNIELYKEIKGLGMDSMRNWNTYICSYGEIIIQIKDQKKKEIEEKYSKSLSETQDEKKIEELKQQKDNEIEKVDGWFKQMTPEFKHVNALKHFFKLTKSKRKEIKLDILELFDNMPEGKGNLTKPYLERLYVGCQIVVEDEKGVVRYILSTSSKPRLTKENDLYMKFMLIKPIYDKDNKVIDFLLMDTDTKVKIKQKINLSDPWWGKKITNEGTFPTLKD